MKIRTVVGLFGLVFAMSGCTDAPGEPSDNLDAFALVLPDFGRLDAAVDADSAQPDMQPQRDVGGDMLPHSDAALIDMTPSGLDAASIDMTPSDLDAASIDMTPPDLDAAPDMDPLMVDAVVPDQAIADMAPQEVDAAPDMAAIDAAPPACQPQPERCDGRDDDCDGVIDEDFELEQACVAGVPGCVLDGRWTCAANGTRTCAAEDGPLERCDGVDNDCDGWPDEGFGVGAPCGQGIGICAREASWACDLDGDVECVVEPGEALDDETCDGQDEDCDGVIDEGLGGVACDGAPALCGDDRGVVTCQRDGLVCLPDPARPQPRFELCNGIDDDCDGHVDERVSARFKPSVNRVARPHYESIDGAFGDIDGDGDPDLVGWAEGGKHLFWRENRDGGLGITHVIDVVDDPSFQDANNRHIIAADFDDDGDADLVAGNKFLLNTNGSFHPPRPIGIAVAPQWASAVDLDVDGRLDLVHLSRVGVYWSRGLGHGRFDAPVQLLELHQGAGNRRPEVFIRDLNGDGLADVFACCRGAFGGEPLWRMNLGGGAFAAPTNPLAVDEVGDAVVGDVDGDGDVDIAYTAGDRIHLALNDGAGAFCTIDTPGDAGNRATLVDMLDLSMDGRGWIITRNSARRFDGQTLVEVPLQANSGRSSIADINGDGVNDILPNQRGILRLSQPDGTYDYDAPNPSAFVDIDRDGVADMIDARGGWRRNLGRRGFGPLRREVGLGDAVNRAFPVDIDGDGIEDIIYRIRSFDGSARWRWQRVLAQGGLSDPIDPDLNLSSQSVQSADLDGQGSPDLVFDGHIVFNLGRGQRRTEGLARHSAVADVDQDGDLDLVVHRGDLVWLPNNGGGRFGDERLIRASEGFGFPDDVFVGDLDGDADTDLVTEIEGIPTAFLNDGGGAMSEVVIAPRRINAIKVIDVDGDGRDEVILDDAIFRLTADGRFDAGQILTYLAESQFVDFDADGDMDILTGFNWIENAGPDGYGMINQPATLPDTPGHTKPDTFEAADIDGDGLLDLVYAERRQVPGVVPGVYWFKQAAPRVFAQQAMLTDEVADPSAVVAHDINNDGRLDLMMISVADDAIYLAYQQDGDFAPPERLGSADGSVRLRLDDVNGDARLDLVAWGGRIGAITYHAGLAGGFEAQAQAVAVLGQANDNQFEFVDLNDDGRPDLVSLIPRLSPLGWRPQMEDGRFGDLIEIELDAVNAGFRSERSFLPTDVDDDGDLDLVVSAARADLYWLANDGDGGFPTGSRFSNADGTGNGRMLLIEDTLISAANNSLNFRQARLVDGRLAEPTSLGTGLYRSRAADVDGDGQLDLVFDLGVAWGTRTCEPLPE